MGEESSLETQEQLVGTTQCFWATQYLQAKVYLKHLPKNIASSENITLSRLAAPGSPKTERFGHNFSRTTHFIFID